MASKIEITSNTNQGKVIKMVDQKATQTYKIKAAPFPKDLLQYLSELQEGDMMTFGNGNAYVCMAKTEGAVKLCRVASKMYQPQLRHMGYEQEFTIRLNMRTEVQAFYEQIMQTDTGHILVKKENLSKAREQIAHYSDGAKKMSSKLVILGPIALQVKQTLLSGWIKWMDLNDAYVSEKKVEILISWLNTAPMVIQIKRKEAQMNEKADDARKKQMLEDFIKKKQYKILGSTIADYCVLNAGRVSVNIKTYVRSERGYEAVSYLFKPDGKRCKILQLTYVNNNFNKSIKDITEITLGDFENICEKRYNEKFTIM